MAKDEFPELEAACFASICEKVLTIPALPGFPSRFTEVSFGQSLPGDLGLLRPLHIALPHQT